MKTSLSRLCVAAVISLAAASAWSQPKPEAPEAWPTKPVRFIVPFAPGGGTDILTRMLATGLEPILGQRIVIENRAGAQGGIGAQAAAKSPADGYTVLVGTIGINAVNQYLYASLPYDPVKDFLPVTVLNKTNNVLSVAPGSPHKSLADLIRFAKQNPDKLNYGIPAVGDSAHLSFEQLKFEGGIPATGVTYNGVPASITDLMGGRLDFLVTAVVAQSTLIAGGKLRPLAVTGEKRSPALPDVPTIAESGFPGFEASGWSALFLPAGTSPVIAGKLAGAVAKAYQQPELAAAMQQRGFELASQTPQEFAAYLAAQRSRWSKVIRDAKIKLEQ